MAAKRVNSFSPAVDGRLLLAAGEPLGVLGRLHDVHVARMSACSVPQYSAQNKWYSPGFVASNHSDV